MNIPVLIPTLLVAPQGGWSARLRALWRMLRQRNHQL